jgi:hypothetical protein
MYSDPPMIRMLSTIPASYNDCKLNIDFTFICHGFFVLFFNQIISKIKIGMELKIP